jgi:hypothetical protein
VMQEVSQFVAERLGLTLDAFMGVLRNPQEAGDQDVVSQSRPFAMVTAQILRKLGGNYTQFAQELEQASWKYSLKSNSNSDYQSLETSSISVTDDINAIFDRIIANEQHTEADRDRLRELLDGSRQLVQSGKYTINLEQGQDIHIGDRIYQGTNAKTIQAILQQEAQKVVIDRTFQRLFPLSASSEVDWDWGMKLLKQKQLPEIRKRLTDRLGRDRISMDISIEEQQNWVNRPPLTADLMLQINGKDSSILDTNKMLIETFGRDDIQGKLLILGAPGAGKTIALLSLAEQLVERAITHPKTVIPSIFELSTWRNEQSIESWLIEQLYDLHGGNRKSKLYEQWLERQVLLPLMDGLDELGLERQKKCMKKLDEFAEHYPYLVVCCRTREFEVADIKMPNLRGTVCFQSLLSDSQIQHYLDSLNRSELWIAIQNTPSLQALLEEDSGLLRVPLFVKLLVDIYDPQQPISSKADLLDKYIDRQLSFDKREIDRRRELNEYKWAYKTTKLEPDQKQTRSYLNWLAQNLQSNNMVEFLIDRIQPSLIQARLSQISLPWNFTRFLNYCVERRLLLRVGKSYRFLHHELLNHFAQLEV